MTVLPIINDEQLEAYIIEQKKLNHEFDADPLYSTGVRIDELEERICEYLNKHKTISDPVLKSAAKLLVQPLFLNNDRGDIDGEQALCLLRELADNDYVFMTAHHIVIAGFQYKLVESKIKTDNGRTKLLYTPYNRPVAIPICSYFWDEYGDEFDRELPILDSDLYIETEIGAEPGMVRAVNFNLADSQRLENRV